MDLTSPKVKSPSKNSVVQEMTNMYQHDPKNILSTASTEMSSILGTTAPYFQQKIQQKAESSSSESKAAFSPPNRGYYTSPKVSKPEGETVFSSPKTITSVPTVSKPQATSLPVKSTPQDGTCNNSSKQGSDISQDIGRQAAAAYYQQIQAQKLQQNSQKNMNSSMINPSPTTPKNQSQKNQHNHVINQSPSTPKIATQLSQSNQKASANTVQNNSSKTHHTTLQKVPQNI